MRTFVIVGIIIAIVMGALIEQKTSQLAPQQVETIPLPRPNPIRKNELALCRAIFTEGRNQPYRGRVAIGQVVLNRAKLYGMSIYDVVHQVVDGRRQFDGVTDNQDWAFKPKLEEYFVWRQDCDLAADMMLGKVVAEGPEASATSYYNPVGSSRIGKCWFDRTQIFLTRIADHIFKRSVQTKSERRWIGHHVVPDECLKRVMVRLPLPRPRILPVRERAMVMVAAN